MGKYVTFCEIMPPLKSPAHERFFKSPSLEATFRGGESNVAIALANYGLDASYVTALPKNDIADACLREIRSFGVDISHIRRWRDFNRVPVAEVRNLMGGDASGRVQR